ncbi:MAG: toll/interleukin-1 receptor domain-containing protein [Planctomycetes bacterium]|nr:toll/interleukin-1 receptor domain-containing protein [Planctomycetota bacterium]
MSETLRMTYLWASVLAVAYSIAGFSLFDVPIPAATTGMGFAAVMLMDACSWGAVPLSGNASRSALLNRIDLVAVIGGVGGLLLMALAVHIDDRLICGTALCVFIYTAGCASYWHFLPRRDYFLLGRVCRAWGLSDSPKEIAGVYKWLFVVCSVVVLLALVVLRLFDRVLAEDSGWWLVAILLWAYALVYFVLGAPRKLLTARDTARATLLPGANVFLSYCHRNKDCARHVREYLEGEHRISVFIDEHDASGGDDLVQFRRAITYSDVLMVLITEESVRSEWVRAELRHALSLGKGGHGRPHVLPVQIGASADAGDIYDRLDLAPLLPIQIADCNREALERDVGPRIESFRRGGSSLSRRAGSADTPRCLVWAFQNPDPE